MRATTPAVRDRLHDDFGDGGVGDVAVVRDVRVRATTITYTAAGLPASIHERAAAGDLGAR
jgi:hypothetical protein